MADDGSTAPREPWKGYAELGPDQRKRLFQAKFDEAGARFDQPYAVALSAAVWNYEALIQEQPGTEHAEPPKAAAGQGHDDAGSWAPN